MIKNFFQGLAVNLLRSWAPEIAIRLLSEVDPNRLADLARPHLEWAMSRMGRDWARAFALALDKIAKFAAAAVPEQPK